MPACLRSAVLTLGLTFFLAVPQHRVQAFLVPTVEMLASSPVARRAGFISALIISPTRELAHQIEEEAKHLCTFHVRTGAVRGTLSIVGGQKISKDHRALQVPATVSIAPENRLLQGILESPHGWSSAPSENR